MARIPRMIEKLNGKFKRGRLRGRGGGRRIAFVVRLPSGAFGTLLGVGAASSSGASVRANNAGGPAYSTTLRDGWHAAARGTLAFVECVQPSGAFGTLLRFNPQTRLERRYVRISPEGRRTPRRFATASTPRRSERLRCGVRPDLWRFRNVVAVKPASSFGALVRANNAGGPAYSMTLRDGRHAAASCNYHRILSGKYSWISSS